jgi:hypothetical protein
VTIQISDILYQRLWGDAAILQYLSLLEQDFHSGRRLALLEAIQICARSQAVMPDWIVDGLTKIDEELHSGRTKDVNDAFGYEPCAAPRRRHNWLVLKHAPDVIARLVRDRLRRGSLSADIAFSSVAEELGIGRRIVESIYKRHCSFIKQLPKGDPTRRVGVLDLSALTEMPRRRGRPIL